MAVPRPNPALGSWAGERALVIGLGVSGLALIRYLSGQGIPVRACELRPADELTEVLPKLPDDVELRLGGYGPEVLDGCGAAFASPGVAWDDPLLEAARARGLMVSSELDLFFRVCPAPIVGVTGTNGKTTTTSLVGEVLTRGDRPVLVGGNIGQTVLDRLQEITPQHWVVLEISSFQLESIERPRPRVGVVLNITPDHLDRHRTFERYLDAKGRMVEFQEPNDHAVLNGHDPGCRRLAERTSAQVVWFDEHQPVPVVAIPGRHNLENALAAAAVGRIAGLSDDSIEAAIAGFTGVEHRLELVGEWGGVRWYNDSKATNPDAAQVGLAAFPGQDVVLIAGGYGGGFELDSWLADVRRSTRAVVLMGASAGLLAERLAGHRVERVDSLEQAVERAAALATPGGLVLLSPGYKSYDMFRSFDDRGRRFKALVQGRGR